MKGFLLDTNVVSKFRKAGKANPGVSRWFGAVDSSELYLSVLVVGELRKGVEMVRSSDPARAANLERWLAELERSFSDQLLPVRTAVADRWGRISAARPTSTTDGLMAATALVHELVLVTRNVADVEHTGAQLLNPFATA